MAGPTGPLQVVVTGLGDTTLDAVAGFVAARQQDPTAHVVLVGDDAGPLAEELAGMAGWRERLLVARSRDGALVGVVLADVDDALRRVWWVGPWVASGRPDAARVAAALLAAADAAHAGAWDEEEYAPDVRNELVADLAVRRGATADTGSAVLVLDPLVVPATEAHGPSVRPVAAADHAAVAALHDALFPNTHTRGEDLVVASDTHVSVVDGGHGTAAGYVAVQVQPDGSGYVDYLGVVADARGAGLGRVLVAGALRRLADEGAGRAHLTVRVDNHAARALYASLGFVEERVVVPYRWGFSLG